MKTDPEAVVERIAERVAGVTRTGRELRGLCPAHDDRAASLQWRAADRDGESGGVLVWCGAGCQVKDIMAAIGMSMADLMAEPHVVASYVYLNEDNQPCYAVERWSNKDFRVRPGLPPIADRVVYNLPWVLYARRAHKTVYVVEGEKDVETLREHGYIGTCNPGGAGRGKWLPHYADWFIGLDVVVIADNDGPGQSHARNVYKALKPVTRSIHLCRPSYGKDATDLLTAGYGLDHVESVLEEAPLGLLHAAAVKPRKPRWAWKGYIPLGTYTLIEGDPGDGKSTLTCDLVARWSTGAPMPDGSPGGGPYHVVMISAEDDPESTMAPRLEVAGADLNNIWFVVSGMTEEQPYNIGADLLAATEALVEQRGIKILVLDPLMAFMPDKVNGHVDAEVRRSMAPLAALARRHDLALVVVRHLTKGATRALYAGSGSIGIIGAARSALLVRPHPQQPDMRVMASLKSNLAKTPASLGYLLVDDPVAEVACLKWQGEIGITADELFRSQHNDEGEGEAAHWLREYLVSVGGTATVQVIKREGARAGVEFEALRKAKRKIGVRSTGKSGPGGEWYWTLVGPAAPWPSEKWAHTSALSQQSPLSGDGNVIQLFQEPDLGEVGEPVKGWGAVPPLVDQQEPALTPEAALDAKPLVCEVCAAEPGDGRTVLRFGEPHFVVRCLAHDPEMYGGDAG